MKKKILLLILLLVCFSALASACEGVLFLGAGPYNQLSYYGSPGVGNDTPQVGESAVCTAPPFLYVPTFASVVDEQGCWQSVFSMTAWNALPNAYGLFSAGNAKNYLTGAVEVQWWRAADCQCWLGGCGSLTPSIPADTHRLAGTRECLL